jgi:predicted RNase H-like HicB family nuclease
VAQGRTIAETLEIAQDVARRLIESYIEHGDPLPPVVRDIPQPKFDLGLAVAIR